MYVPESVEIAAGTAKATYYTYTTGDFADEPKNQAADDFKAIDLDGLVITVAYDDESKTKEITVDENTKLVLAGQFGTVADDKWTVSGDGSLPATAGAYAIQVSLDVDGDGDQPAVAIGNYAVTVLPNRVESTALYVADDYTLYTDGKTTISLNADKIYVTKTMSNGQVLKAAANEVAWSETRASLESTMTNNAMTSAITVDVNVGATTNVFAKYVGYL